jgi:hypothetical protein
VARSSEATVRLAGRLGALVQYEWPDREDREGLLKQVNLGCLEIHDHLIESYFDYPV